MIEDMYKLICATEEPAEDIDPELVPDEDEEEDDDEVELDEDGNPVED